SIYRKTAVLSNTSNDMFALGGCSARQGRVLRRVKQRSVLLYTTAAAQQQGARLPAIRRRGFDFFTTNNFLKKLFFGWKKLDKTKQQTYITT
ncbi:MAG: hypothetical protein J6S90_02545, partial [Lentisphaeria bacterium]|nr:hypothetical protein [Lentisphaeria bacterium]